MSFSRFCGFIAGQKKKTPFAINWYARLHREENKKMHSLFEFLNVLRCWRNFHLLTAHVYGIRNGALTWSRTERKKRKRKTKEEISCRIVHLPNLFLLLKRFFFSRLISDMLMTISNFRYDSAIHFSLFVPDVRCEDKKKRKKNVLWVSKCWQRIPQLIHFYAFHYSKLR